VELFKLHADSLVRGRNSAVNRAFHFVPSRFFGGRPPSFPLILDALALAFDRLAPKQAGQIISTLWMEHLYFITYQMGLYNRTDRFVKHRNHPFQKYPCEAPCKLLIWLGHF
jgi:hypothetical protein